MKPNFALTLSFDGIGLLHRAFPGWNSVGEVSLDSSTLAADLAALSDKAQAFDANGVYTKLVLPNDQIRYLQLDATDLAPDEIADAVARALEGVTPYALNDLAYDWSISAGQVYVAAVAKDTLSEAEAFADNHGFNPLAFVAIPENMDFVGEPWFGETKAAAKHVPAGGFVERDTAAIRVIGTARLPESLDRDPPVAAPELTIPPAPQEDTLEALEDLTPSTPEVTAPADPIVEDLEEAQEDVPTEASAPPVSVLQDPVIPDEETQEPSSLAEDETGDLEEEDIVPEFTSPYRSGAASDTAEPLQDNLFAEVQDTDADEMSSDQDAEDMASDKGEEDEATSVTVAFSSIRASRDDTFGVTPKLTGATRELDTPAPQEEQSPELEVPTRIEPILSAELPALADEPPASDFEPEAQEFHEAVSDWDTPADAFSVSEDDANRIGASLSASQEDRLMAAVPATPEPVDEPSFATQRDALIARAAARYSDEEPAQARNHEDEDERQRMTIFGAREPVEIGGKPRFLGVMLTAALLVFLVGVAAWASIFLDDGLSRFLRSEPSSTTVASVPETEPAVVEDLIEEEPEFTLQTEDFGTTLASLPGETIETDDPARAAQPEARPAQLNADEARARYAVTGVWQRAPDAPTAPESIALEDFYLTSIDPKVLEQDAVALPDVASLQNDVPPGAVLSPPAADTLFSFDERGLVQATPQGALTPNGVQVFAGQPRLVPGTRPDTPAQLVTDGETATPVDPALARLADIRPKPRPGDLAEQNERENLGGLTRSELATLRPKLRPQSAQELALQAAAASTAAVEVSPDAAAVEAAIAAAVQQPDPFAGATAQAVDTSRKPKPRPRNFAQIVQRSQRQAQEAVRTAAVVVPSNQRVSPSAPTATTVARAATEQNVLKLRRVNLIGVYGSQSNRRALVRLANGRYTKVKVGDRLDGGRVSAIGDSEIRYVKSGRNVILKMPRG